MEPTFFRSSEEWRQWLAENHNQSKELLVGFYKKKASEKGITYAEALDEALCFGWIDGVRKSVDESRYTIRFTPRKSNSIWSVINIKRVGELTELGRMQPAGLKAFNEHSLQKSPRQYSYEADVRKLDGNHEAHFRANQQAWDFFQRQPPGYQRTAAWWVMSAKKEETRLRRLNILIEESEKGQRLAAITGKTKG